MSSLYVNKLDGGMFVVVKPTRKFSVLEVVTAKELFQKPKVQQSTSANQTATGAQFGQSTQLQMTNQSQQLQQSQQQKTPSKEVPDNEDPELVAPVEAADEDDEFNDMFVDL